MTLVLLALVLWALYTDVRWHKVFNWTTYPGIALALGANAVASTFGPRWGTEGGPSYGLIGFEESLCGLLLCGFLVLICYVFFPGGIGGGDVKLIAMMGAFLGPLQGLEALLWTFVLGGCLAIIVLIWQYGAWRLLVSVARFVWLGIRFRAALPLSGDERRRLQARLVLSPGALAAVCIVQFPRVFSP